jgi:lysozyme
MDILAQLRRDEGRRYKPYLDTAVPPRITIGDGFNLTDSGLDDDEINFITQHRVTKLLATLNQYAWFSGLDAIRQFAIVNMAYNLGVSGLLHFPHMVAALGKMDWPTAAQEMLGSLWATQVGDRATRLAKQIETGEWQ